MSDKNAKLIRAQIRNVVQEMLPEILHEEEFKELYNRLREEIISRVSLIESRVIKSLDEMSQRQKDFSGLLVREMTAQQSFKPSNSSIKGE